MSQTSAKLIPETELRSLSRHLVSLLPKNVSNSSWTYSRSPEDLYECLLYTAGLANLSAKHRAAACDALGGFLDHGLSSTLEIQDLCRQPQTWQAALDVYLERSEDTVKPMKQLLGTLVRTLSKRTDPQAETIVQEAVTRCLRLISTHEDLSCVKPAMLILELLLNKGRITALQILWIRLHNRSIQPRQENSSHGVTNGSTTFKPDESMVNDFTYSVLEWACYAHIAPAVGKLLTGFFKTLQSSQVSRQIIHSTLPLWIAPVRRITEENEDMSAVLERLLLPDLLKADYAGSKSRYEPSQLLDDLGLQGLAEGVIGEVPEEDIRFYLLMLSCMGGTDDPSNSQAFELLFELLSHASSEISNSALFFLFPTYRALPSTFTSRHLLSLLKILPSFHLETDARARNEFLGITKKILSNFNTSLSRTPKTDSSQSIESRHLGSLEEADTKSWSDPSLRLLGFSVRYIAFLYDELQPVASYQRHFSALRVLKHAISTELTETAKIDTFTPLILNSLLSLTLDAYDDVRASAASLLKHFPSNLVCEALQPSSKDNDKSTGAIERAEKLMRLTGRADYADGVGRLYDLYFECCISNPTSGRQDSGPFQIVEHLLTTLEHDVQVAENNLHLAVASAPLHGRFISLKYIISRTDLSKALPTSQDWETFHHRLMTTFEKVWEIVKPVLCIDSPEGQGEGDEDEYIDIGVKDTLSYSWRTLKESSSTMQVLLNNDCYGNYQSQRLLTRDEFKSMGDLSFAQLGELRHRGAFSTVSQAFTSCCIQSARSTDPNSQELTKLWFEEALKCIEAKASALTRRSAGLPAMMCGILTPHVNDNFFGEALARLQLIACKDPKSTDVSSARLPQVHALNCIKDIFVNSRLAPSADKHLASTLEMAVKCLESDIWAIRNCGIMLFKALLTRLTGGSGSNTVATGARHRRFPRAVYKKYPQLTDILLQQLRKSCEFHEDVSDENASHTRQMQVGFSAMEIMDRVGIPPEKIEEIEELLLFLLNNPVWNIREKAARTLSTFISAETVIFYIEEAARSGHTQDNKLHGLLLCLHDIIQTQDWSKLGAPADIIDSTLRLFHSLVPNATNPFVGGMYLKIITVLLKNLETPPRFLDTAYGTSNHDLWTSLYWTQRKAVIASIVHKLLLVHANPPACYKHHFFAENQDRLTTELVSNLNTWLQASSLRSLLDGAEDISVGWRVQHWWRVFLRALIGSHASPCVVIEIKLLLDSYQHSISLGKQKFFEASQLDYLAERIADCPDRLIRRDWESLSDEVFDLISSVLSEDSSFKPAEPSAEAPLLKLEGAMLAFVYHKPSPMPDLGKFLPSWGRRLQFALDERSELPLRIAAASSILYFREILRPCTSNIPKCEHEFLLVYLALYMALLDDDDEVRTTAATAASWILSTAGALKSLNPYIAAEEMISLFSTHLKSDPQLCKEGLVRVTGSQSWQQSRPADEFTNVLKEDTTLFVEEKQNLYIDPVTEAKRWSKVLCSLPQEARMDDIHTKISDWAKQGLKTMIDLSSTNVDGALGWTSKDEVFTLGMRAICMTEIAVNWSPSSGRPDTAKELTSMLQELADVGERNAVNGHWMIKVRSLLSKS